MERASASAIELNRAAVRIAGRTIWSEVSMHMRCGEFVALLGANGSGKSTLLNTVIGALRLSAGELEVLGRPPGAANQEIGYLPQRRSFASGTRLRGADLVRLGLDGHRWGLPLPVVWGEPARRRRAERAQVLEAIERVGASEVAMRPLGELSGGEQQRLLIAQALVRSPKLLLLDEPLDSLDLASQGSVAALLGEICREREIGVLLVAHDVNPLLPYLDRVVYLAAGHAAEGPVEEVVTTATLTRLYSAPVEVLRASDGRLVVVGQPEPPVHHHDHHTHAHDHHTHDRPRHAHDHDRYVPNYARRAHREDPNVGGRPSGG